MAGLRDIYDIGELYAQATIKETILDEEGEWMTEETREALQTEIDNLFAQIDALKEGEAMADIYHGGDMNDFFDAHFPYDEEE